MEDRLELFVGFTTPKTHDGYQKRVQRNLQSNPTSHFPPKHVRTSTFNAAGPMGPIGGKLVNNVLEIAKLS
jgi:hypothetical protein